MPLRRMPIVFSDEAWICADAFIGPGVTVGERAVVGARAVAIRDVPADMLVAGNPALAVKPRVIRDNGAEGDSATFRPCILRGCRVLAVRGDR
jgi:putative colanic acid biosynthesis acetyltransferase WcaF